MIRFQRPCQLVRHGRDLIARLGAVEGGVEMDAFAPAGHRHRVQPHAQQQRAHQAGHFGAFGQPRALARVQVEHHAIRVLPGSVATEPPLRHMDFEGGLLRDPDQGGQVIDERVLVDVVGVLDRPARDPVRGRGRQVLLKEHLTGFVGGSDAGDPALAGRWPIPRGVHERIRDPRVVVDDLGFGGSGLGVEHLVEVGEA
jgi:hypothetical protein